MPGITEAGRPLHQASSTGQKRLIVIRGDIRSQTGYARAVRALSALIPDPYDVKAVDIHPDPCDCSQAAGLELVQDGDLPGFIDRSILRPIIIHYTSPDDFRFFPGAYNVGAFYWETNAVPYARAWPLKLNLMDAIWAPTAFVARFVRDAGYQGALEIVTWPHEFGPLPDRRDLPVPEVDAIYLPLVPDDGVPVRPQLIQLPDLRRQADLIFLAVQSLAPRKGTRVLLNEWRSYLYARPNHDILLLRLSFRHTTDISGDPLSHFATMLRDAGFQPGERPQIALMIESVSDELLRQIYSSCDVYVSASYGEGFGGPVIEALQQGCPVIAPRHTGLLDLLPADYSLAVQSRSMVIGLKGSISAYPLSSNWHVPVPGALANRFKEFASMHLAERTSLATTTRSHAAGFCSFQMVRRQLLDALSRLLHAPPSALAGDVTSASPPQ